MRAAPRPRVLGAVGLGLLAIACDRGPEPASEGDLRDATYLSAAAETGTVNLTDGEFLQSREGGRILHVRFVTHATGDLDGDGDDDAAVILAENTGDQDILFHVHALLRDGTRAEDVSSRMVGDRIQVRGIRIVDGLIEADLTIREQGQPVVIAPSVPVTLTYALTDRGLVQAKPPAGLGRAAVAPRDDPPGVLASFDWELVEVRAAEGELVPTARSGKDAPPRITFSEQLRDAEGASGRVYAATGCNLVFGEYRAAVEGELRIGALATTLRTCDPARRELDRRVTAALSSVVSFDLAEGELRLIFADGSLRYRRVDE